MFGREALFVSIDSQPIHRVGLVLDVFKCGRNYIITHCCFKLFNNKISLICLFPFGVLFEF